MKQFTFDKSQAQRDEVILYSFHPDALAASKKDLADHLVLLCQYVPTRDTPWNDDSQAIKNGTPIHDTWFQAHNHISKLLQEKKETIHRRWIIGISAISTAALLVGLAYRVVVANQELSKINNELKTLQEQLHILSKPVIKGCALGETTTNKSSNSDGDKATAGS